MTAPALLLHPLSLALGSFVVWAAHFSLAYGAHAMACEGRLPAGFPGMAAIILGAAGIAVLLLAIFGWRVWRHAGAAGGQAGRFLDRLAVGSALLAAMAIIWQSLAPLLIAGCGQGAG